MISCIRADNPGPMTLTGTNTWMVPSEGGHVVIDPGPSLPEHLESILAVRPVELIILTHRHHDHADLAPDLAVRAGAPIRAMDPTLCRDGEPLVDGEELPGGVSVVATPGHTDDSVCLPYGDVLTSLDDRGAFRDRRDSPRAESRGTAADARPGAALFTGDTVLGTGSSVIMYGDGSVADSLASLERLLALVERHAVTRLLPGHGPEVMDPAARLRHDLAHRRDRIAQVRAVTDAGVADVAAVTATVHLDLDPRVLPAAETSIAAHLDHLGLLAPDDPWLRHRGESGRPA